jgi:hypothetical protein
MIMSESETVGSQLALIQGSDLVMATWSEEKKKDFATTFENRAKSARYLLLRTAYHTFIIAQNRKFLSNKHLRLVKVEETNAPSFLYDLKKNERDYNETVLVGGRAIGELEEIAKERATKILDELPSVQKALEIISPDVAKKMAKRQQLIEEGQKLVDELEENSKPVSMSSVDQNMTVGKFLAQVKEIETFRCNIFDKLQKIGKEGNKLDAEINEALYAGIPGLSDAVINVINTTIERSKAMSETTRRVTERVVYGDSAAALEMLKHFEKDELTVSDEVKSEFAGALEKLKLLGLRGKKKPGKGSK